MEKKRLVSIRFLLPASEKAKLRTIAQKRRMPLHKLMQEVVDEYNKTHRGDKG